MRLFDRLRAPFADTPVLAFPPDLLRLQGAFSYGAGWNPLVACLTHGVGELSSFYDAFRPPGLAEFYFLARSGETGEDLPPWTLPWLSWEDHRPPSAEGGLNPREHGVSYYGPCSAEKLAFEHQRLTRLKESIARQGYRPERFGHIQGFLMLRDAEIRFFVRGGKHRAAALAALGCERVPVKFRRGWPPVVDRAAAAGWPLVTEGRISLLLATQMFDRYFEHDGSEQRSLLGLGHYQP